MPEFDSAQTSATGVPQPPLPSAQTAPAIQKPLSRKRSFKIDKAQVVHSILTRYDQDVADRRAWEEMRLQRTAKLRGWLEPKSWPWRNAANTHTPMLMSDSLR